MRPPSIAHGFNHIKLLLVEGTWADFVPVDGRPNIPLEPAMRRHILQGGMWLLILCILILRAIGQQTSCSATVARRHARRASFSSEVLKRRKAYTTCPVLSPAFVVPVCTISYEHLPCIAHGQYQACIFIAALRKRSAPSHGARQSPTCLGVHPCFTAA